MSKIFISHSSVDNAAALAVGQWLAENGWDDFFLDIEPARGLSPGERWQEALKAAADRCEAVLCLITPAWRDSRWCLAELLLAKQLGKVIFGAFIETMPLDSLPREMTAEWQLCDLVEGSERRLFRVGSDPVVPTTEVSFAAPGLQRLKLGLQKSGLDAATFPWPPPADSERAPYRGFKALTAEDAAVFFGREAEMVRGLDTLRRLRERDVERMLVLLGASGAGKSSFLKAGLWPRLGRDDRRFLPLPVLRPEKAVLSGPSGLAASLEVSFRGLKQPRSRADVRSALAEPGGLDRLLTELQSLAGHRLGADASPPTMVLGIDQAEELLGTEGPQEAETFLSLLAEALASSPRRVMAVLAIRSDSFERLQAEPLLAGSRWALFDLRPMARAEYKSVIEGPAARATAAGRPLRIDPELTERLLGEAEGADALPLLAFTLERLFVEYGGDGALSLPEYEALGGLRGSVEEVVRVAFAEPERAPTIPVEEAERLRRLKEGFIPWLARIDPDTEERKRRVARWDELPAESRPLIERLITARLLVSDRCRIEGHDSEVVVVEVAHEALLRQWPTLTAWLDTDAADLRALEATRRAAGEWKRNDGQADWLAHTGDRLRAAEALRRRPDFDRLLGDEGKAYLEACRRRDDQAQKDREDQAHRVARAQRLTWALLALIAVVLVGAGTWILQQTREVARQTSLVLAANALAANDAGRPDRALRFSLLALRGGWLSTAAPEAEAQLARAAHASRLIAQIRHGYGFGSASFSPDGRRVVSTWAENAYVWDPETGVTLFDIPHAGGLAASFCPDGRRGVSLSGDGTIHTWDTATKKILGEVKHDQTVRFSSFSADCRRVMAADLTGEISVWDVETGKTLAHDRLDKWLTFASLSPDGTQVVYAGRDRKVAVWNIRSRKKAPIEIEHDQRVTSASFNPDGRQLVLALLDGTTRVRDKATGEVLAQVEHDDYMDSVSFSPDSGRVVGFSRFGTALVWDASPQRPLADIKQPSIVEAVALSPDNGRVLSGLADGTVVVSDVRTGRVLTKFRHGERVTSVSFGPLGRRTVSASVDGTVRVSDALTGQRLAEVKHSRPARFASFSPSGKEVVSVSDDRIRVWNASTGRPTSEMMKEAFSASFSPDGHRVASTSYFGPSRMWDVATGKPIATGARYLDPQGLSALKFSPDGRRVFGFSLSGIVTWSAERLETLSEVKGDQLITSASFSSDGRRVVGVSEKNIFVLDTVTGRVLARFGQSEVESSASFSPDGQRMVSASKNGAVRVWDTHWLTLARQELVADVCREKLVGATVLTLADIKTAPVLRGRQGEDVCAPPTWLDRLKELSSLVRAQ
jgi:WD40 repeat protein